MPWIATAIEEHIMPAFDPFGLPETQKQRYDAAMEFDALLQESFVNRDKNAHAGTILSVAAWLTGTCLSRALRSRQDPAPGALVLPGEVDESRTALMSLFLYYCRRNGIELKPEQFSVQIPHEHRPHLGLPRARQVFQKRFDEIMRKHGLDELDSARAGVMVCSMEFYYHCMHVRDIEPHVAAGLVSLGILTGVRTAPQCLPSTVADPDRNKYLFDVMVSIAQNSTTGAGNRLVLGEGPASMREALNRGGKYILIHPDVLSLFDANDIDAFTVYTAAMQMEIESRIPQIDFAGADVDMLLQQWSDRSEGELPIHVRQIRWLKANARKSGYEQCGNSWRLSA
jgi:hypothetical protein